MMIFAHTLVLAVPTVPNPPDTGQWKMALGPDVHEDTAASRALGADVHEERLRFSKGRWFGTCCFGFADEDTWDAIRARLSSTALRPRSLLSLAMCVTASRALITRVPTGQIEPSATRGYYSGRCRPRDSDGCDVPCSSRPLSDVFCSANQVCVYSAAWMNYCMDVPETQVQVPEPAIATKFGVSFHGGGAPPPEPGSSTDTHPCARLATRERGHARRALTMYCDVLTRLARDGHHRHRPARGRRRQRGEGHDSRGRQLGRHLGAQPTRCVFVGGWPRADAMPCTTAARGGGGRGRRARALREYTMARVHTRLYTRRLCACVLCACALRVCYARAPPQASRETRSLLTRRSQCRG